MSKTIMDVSRHQGVIDWDKVKASGKVDGVMLRTGKPYTPIGKIPVWAYVVSALNLAQIMNGAVGGVLAVLGIFLTLRLSTSENLAPALRVLLSIAYLVVSWAAVFALAFLLVSSGTIYY